MSKKKTKKSAYAAAGVDIDEMMDSLSAIKKMVKKTSTAGVLSDIGTFGGLFKSPGKDSIIVASTDGVGTKLKVAQMAGRHDTVGQDIVNHCVDDILVQGARPLFFMDYVGTSQLKSTVFKDIVSGLCKACRENGCALLGGETAEMPGLYPKGEYDLVGTIVGVAKKKDIVTGQSIKKGDIIIGLPSVGLHTNGFSLARDVIFKKARLKVTDNLPGTKKTIANLLLAPHKSYLNPIMTLMKKVKVHGMAHITGGGLIDNVPRIMPTGTCAVIDRATWKVSPLFSFIQERGKIDREEMYRVFNMGIAYTVIVRKKDAQTAFDVLKKAKAKPVLIGHVEKADEKIRFLS